MSPPPRLLLLDIDATLADFRGVGRVAMVAAGREVFGPGFHMRGIRFGGRLDGDMLREALRARGLDQDPTDARQTTADPGADPRIERFRQRYVAALRSRLSGLRVPDVRLAGVRTLLEALERRPWVTPAVLTGNFHDSALVKLRASGIDPDRLAFIIGADDGPTRRDLVDAALVRADRLGRGPFEPRHVVVVGDTPHDMDCARHHHAVAVGVTTGKFGRGPLEEAGADLVLPDLRDLSPLLRYLDG